MHRGGLVSPSTSLNLQVWIKHKRYLKDTDHHAEGWGFLREESYLKRKKTLPIFFLLLLQLCADFILLSFPPMFFITKSKGGSRNRRKRCGQDEEKWLHLRQGIMEVHTGSSAMKQNKRAKGYIWEQKPQPHLEALSCTQKPFERWLWLLEIRGPDESWIPVSPTCETWLTAGLRTKWSL